MKAKEIEVPGGATCHNWRDKDGQWWVVWAADFAGDESGRKPHPESLWLEDAYRWGIREVVEWIEDNNIFGYIGNPNNKDIENWQTQKKRWGIEKE